MVRDHTGADLDVVAIRAKKGATKIEERRVCHRLMVADGG